MSVAGLKKQFHKATQKVSEKVGGAEGTKLDDDFKEMEKKVDTTSRAVLDIMTRTTEYLQPNPASRAKLSMINTVSKIRGQEKGPGYPQAESVLGDAMQKFVRELGEESSFVLNNQYQYHSNQLGSHINHSAHPLTLSPYYSRQSANR
ncbi:endophilin-A1-like isoform X2 [Salminus brasiliensis]|uniref:endophilin-A1-like isoform X2 n=1 Tax=Salminus brasiliensis TaxID=930266 RepID=UPI003B832EB3